MPPAKTERTYCPSCGFPPNGQRCEVCGSALDPLALVGNALRVAPSEGDAAGLDRAHEAFRAKDFPRAIEHALASDATGAVRAKAAPTGSGFIAIVRGALIFASIRTATDELTIEAPIVRLPEVRRVPVMRAALELCAREDVTSRLCLRGDLLLLGYTGPLGDLTPVLLRRLTREMAHLSSRYAELLAVTFGARPAIAEAQRALVGFEALGEPKILQLGGAIAPAPASPPKARAPVNNGPANGPSAPAPAPAARKPEAPRAKPSDDEEEELPPILAPAFAAPKRPPPLPQAAPSKPPPPPLAPPMAPRPSKPPPPPAAAAIEPARKPSIVMSRLATMPEIEIDAAPSRRMSSPDVALAPADRLCALLRQAQSLASIALARPATMTWIVRATVYRAIYEFRDTLPEAVAHLSWSTGFARDMAKGGSLDKLPAAEPALPVMERIIAARATMPKDKPLVVEPMASAAQAKEMMGRYIAEIERSPEDPSLRHFLALGALTELLVRTKMPAQTDQRLREIIAHAQREGPKPPALALMMTSLQRIQA